MRALAVAFALAVGLAPATASAQRAAAQSVAELDTVRRGLVAQYEAALIRERRLADQREVTLIAQYETRIRDLRRQYDAGAANALPQLAAARAEFAAAVQPIAARDPDVRELVQNYETQLSSDIAQSSPEQLAALQRFADGDQEEGFRQFRAESERRSAARRRAAEAAADSARRADAADARQLARMANTMRLSGRATLAEVLEHLDRAAELDPAHVETHLDRVGTALSMGDVARAQQAIETAGVHARTTEERIDVLTSRANIAAAQGQPDVSRGSVEEAIALARQAYTGLDRDFALSDLYLDLGSIQEAQGDRGGARNSYAAALEHARAAAAAEPDEWVHRNIVAVLLLKSAEVQGGDLPLARAQLSEAFALLQEAVTRDPSAFNLVNAGVVAMFLSDAAEKQGDATEAERRRREGEALLARALEADPNNAQALNVSMDGQGRASVGGG